MRHPRVLCDTTLLADGTVLKAGSTGGFGDNRKGSILRDPKTGVPWMTVHTDAERYFPSYLWRGPRPVIESVGVDGYGLAGAPDADVRQRDHAGRLG
ncbi:hypothetical protein NGB36_26010 [Streptomyces sp. RB6PN25]|uniref:Uncharacterized protein n=1 Tax=Streptomyces humicola TaxID=2953240 RepID=A0ABT1Q5B4_9ACTN|nr:hypothetical protein [Streptomyces humicola]MCQ4083947.1 hypothetical protein [Streptomyces humicola]